MPGWAVSRRSGRRRRRGDDADDEEAAEIPWDRLRDDRARVRFLYRHFLLLCMRAGFRFDGRRTPNQVCSDILAWDPATADDPPRFTGLYNDARYGPEDAVPGSETIGAALMRTRELEAEEAVRLAGRRRAKEKRSSARAGFSA